MSESAKEIAEVTSAKTGARAAAMLELLSGNAKPMSVWLYTFSAVAAGISGSIIARHFLGEHSPLIAVVALSCSALSLAFTASVECNRLRKRLEAAVTVLLKQEEDVG
jgi:hypothetical protein